MIVRMHTEAEEELEEACDYLNAQARGLAQRFLDDFRDALAKVAAHPTAWPREPGHRTARYYRFATFSFKLVYNVHPDHCLIVAVMHLSRKPGYWRNRR